MIFYSPDANVISYTYLKMFKITYLLILALIFWTFEKSQCAPGVFPSGFGWSPPELPLQTRGSRQPAESDQNEYIWSFPAMVTTEPLEPIEPSLPTVIPTSVGTTAAASSPPSSSTLQTMSETIPVPSTPCPTTASPSTPNGSVETTQSSTSLTVETTKAPSSASTSTATTTNKQFDIGSFLKLSLLNDCSSSTCSINLH